MSPNNFYADNLPGPLGYKEFGADWNSGVRTRPLVLTTEAGVVACYLWVNAARLYAKFSATAPTSATDGVIVGTQT